MFPGIELGPRAPTKGEGGLEPPPNSLAPLPNVSA